MIHCIFRGFSSHFAYFQFFLTNGENLLNLIDRTIKVLGKASNKYLLIDRLASINPHWISMLLI